ncbi:MAG: GPP34 family phosphoprotein [Rhodospirillaceae bacterium]|nr:GPP34 family phosphoprotein [Rhodospirillaceae bacterium]
MLRFSEEIMLLLLDDKGGRFIDVPTLSLEYALAGAVLMDLTMEGRIDTDPERLFVIDPSPIGDDLLDPVLARIVESEETQDTRYWIKHTVADAEAIRERSLARLVGRGILHREEDRFMWVLRTRRYPIDDYKTVREVKLRIMGVILSDDIPDARDIIIISLADICRIFEGLLSGRELKSAAARIDQIRQMDLIGREVSKAVTEIETSLAMAFVPMH